VTRAALLLATALLATAPAPCGPWGPGDESLYVKLSYGYLATDELATPDGATHEIPDYRRQEGALFLAYGVSDRVTALLEAPLYRRSSIEGFDEAAGAGDLGIGGQLELLRRGRFVLAALASVQAPTGDEAKGGGLLPTGTGVWEGESVLSGGTTFLDGRGLAYLEAGYRIRGGELRDAAVAEAHVEGRLGERLTLGLHLSAVRPLGGDRDTPAGSASGLGDGVQYLAYGPVAAIELPRGLSLHLELEDTTAVQNVATGLTARIGISLRR